MQCISAHSLSTTSYTGVLNFNTLVSNATPYPVTAPQTWQFRYYNTSDDLPGAGVADARINSLLVELAFDDTPNPTPPVTVADLGTLSDNAGAGFNGADSTINLTFGAGQVQFLKFTLAEGAFASRFLDIDTNGSTLSATNDTEIGLYDITGALIGTDDDDAIGNLSQLSYGATGNPRPAIGNGSVGNGRDGSLAAGTYYLAVGAFDTTFANGFAATSTSVQTGTVTVNFRTNVVGAAVVPEANAGILALLGAAPLGFLARRRK